MSDVSGLEISDLFGLSQPLTKLVETVSGGLDTLYKPWHLKRMAKARAEEIKLISEAITQNAMLPINYQHGNVGIDSTDVPNLLARTQQRLLQDEVKKQQNMDAVVANAVEELRTKEKVSETPVDEDWSTRFRNIAKDVSSEEMQLIWGKVLAGEVEEPGSFSMRTLETIRNLSKAEASKFQKIIPFVIWIKEKYFISSQASIIKKYGIEYSDILVLSECGLIVESASIPVCPILKKGEIQSLVTDERVALIRKTTDANKDVMFGAYVLTNAGRELYGILAHSPNNDYFLDVIEHVYKCNASMIDATVHERIQCTDDGVRCSATALRTFTNKK